MYHCQFCQRSFERNCAKGFHEKYCKENPLRVKRVTNQRRPGKSSDPEKEALRRQKISEKMSQVGGGYRQGSGRGKQGWYKGYWCDSSWELAWVVYSIDHSVSFNRNWTKFPYSYGGKERSYIPDFVLSTGEYVEIKGYETEQSKKKIESFPENLIVLKESEMKPILEYVIGKYGKNYVELYGE